MSAPERDEELEAFLARRSLLPRALAEQENAEPSAESDRLVLAKAREAIAPARKVVRPTRWMVPVALAATIVLSLAIVVAIRRPDTQDLTAASARPQSPVVMRAERYEAPLAKSEPAPAAQQRAESATGVAADSAAASNEVQLEDSRQRAAVASESRRSAEQSATAEAREQSVEADAASPPPAQSKRDADPREWLKRIEQLRAEGKTAEAERELQALRKRYPDYVAEDASK